MPHVMTVLGPIDPAALGPTDAHDHLFMQTPALPADTLADLDRAIAELEEGRASGLAAVVELTPIGMGRRPDLLAEASRRTGLKIVAATGYHRDVHYLAGNEIFNLEQAALEARVTADLRAGMAGTGIRAGVIKGGASLDGPSPAEARRLRAIARASIATGTGVVVHTEAGTGGLAIISEVTREGLSTERVALAHMDRRLDPAAHREVLDQGVWLVYDTIGRDKYAPDSARVDLIETIVAAGFGDRLMLGLDLGRRNYFRSYGGAPGMRHLMATFVPMLRQRIGNEATHAMLTTNPARFLTIANG